MKISKTLVLPAELTATIKSDENVNSDPDYLKDQSFSTQYVSAGASDVFEVELTFTRQNVGYICLAGHNFGAIRATVEVSCGAYKQHGCTFNNAKNQVLVFAIPQEQQWVESITLRVTKNTSDIAKIAHIGIGEMFDVPNHGEQAGYGYPFYSNHYEVRAQQASTGAPLESLIKVMSPTVNLRIKNVKKSWVKDVWMSLVQGFVNGFISIVHDSADEGYILYNPKIPPAKAHAMTRELLDVSLSGKAYHGE